MHSKKSWSKLVRPAAALAAVDTSYSPDMERHGHFASRRSLVCMLTSLHAAHVPHVDPGQSRSTRNWRLSWNSGETSRLTWSSGWRRRSTSHASRCLSAPEQSCRCCCCCRRIFHQDEEGALNCLPPVQDMPRHHSSSGFGRFARRGSWT